MTCHTLRSGCKINLFLHIGERLADGYHSLESLFMPLPTPHDIIEVRQGKNGTRGIRTVFSILKDGSRLPCPFIDTEKNTVTKAYAWYAEQTGFSPALDVHILKNVPTGGGLGGGSANAAALLRYINAEAVRRGLAGLQEDEMIAGSKAIGADVPFFLLNQLSYVSGIGEVLKPVDIPLPGDILLLACPALPVSTSWAFSALDAAREKNKKSLFAENSLTSWGHQASNPLRAGWIHSGNDFEEIVFTRHPLLRRLKQDLLTHGATLARMSGTGASLFAFFQDEAVAKKAGEKIANDGIKVYIQRINDTGV